MLRAYMFICCTSSETRIVLSAQRARAGAWKIASPGKRVAYEARSGEMPCRCRARCSSPVDLHRESDEREISRWCNGCKLRRSARRIRRDGKRGRSGARAPRRGKVRDKSGGSASIRRMARAPKMRKWEMRRGARAPKGRKRRRRRRRMESKRGNGACLGQRRREARAVRAEKVQVHRSHGRTRGQPAAERRR